MSSPVRTYQTEMHRNLGFFATWLPGDPIEIGDAGVLAEGRFRRLSSLRDLGIPYSQNEVGNSQSVQYTSADGTKIGSTTGATVKGIAKAQIEIDFSADGAFVFHATGLRARRIRDLTSVGHDVVRAYRKQRWRKEWLLVETLHTADCATIILSQDKSAKLVLTAKADALVSTLSLADPSIGLQVSSSHGKLVHVVGAQGLRPLFSCVRIEASFFAEPTIAPARGAGTQTIEFERPQINDLLES
jgi:hypothetical protein